jgi:hypothetical protein
MYKNSAFPKNLWKVPKMAKLFDVTLAPGLWRRRRRDERDVRQRDDVHLHLRSHENGQRDAILRLVRPSGQNLVHQVVDR